MKVKEDLNLQICRPFLNRSTRIELELESTATQQNFVLWIQLLNLNWHIVRDVCLPLIFSISPVPSSVFVVIIVVAISII